MFTPEFFSAIMVYSGSVVGFVEVFKRTLHLNGWPAILVSFIASMALCLHVFQQGWLIYVAYVVGVFFASNGLFKAFHTKVTM